MIDGLKMLMMRIPALASRVTRCRSVGPTQYRTPGARGHRSPVLRFSTKTLTGTHVVRLPVILVPEVRALAAARSRFGHTETDPIGLCEQTHRRRLAMRNRDDPTFDRSGCDQADRALPVPACRCGRRPPPDGEQRAHREDHAGDLVSECCLESLRAHTCRLYREGNDGRESRVKKAGQSPRPSFEGVEHRIEFVEERDASLEVDGHLPVFLSDHRLAAEAHCPRCRRNACSRGSNAGEGIRAQ